MNALKNIILQILYFKAKFVWILESYFERNMVVVKNENVSLSEIFGRILILAPHSDDEWIGCSKILSSKKNECMICNLNFVGGDDTEVHLKRVNEMENMAKHYNCLFTSISNLSCENLQEVISNYQPDYICIPYFIDWHHEHVVAINLAKSAICDSDFAGKIMLYQISCPMPICEINYAIPMNKNDLIKKWNIFFSMYKTQANIPAERFLCNERVSGKVVNSYAAEVFSIIDKDKWVKKFILIPNYKERKLLLDNINNLRLIRKFVNLIYRERVGVEL